MRMKLIENELYDDDDDDYQCSTCFSFGTSTGASPTLNNETQKQKKLNSNFKTHQDHQENQQQQQTYSMLTSKDLVGNSKEFRIENNKYNLRIIGNDNRIRIAQNSGNLQIIGNNTRLKITKNNGNIKYTGNEGRICLGSESTQQIVDYIGCNGLLKVINSMELNKSPKCSVNNNSRRKTTIISDKVNHNRNEKVNLPGNASMGTSPNTSTTTTFPQVSTSLGPRVKSASFDGLIDVKNENVEEFNTFLQNQGWQHFAKVSLPNLKENYNEPCDSDWKCKKNQNKSFINNIHNINNRKMYSHNKALNINNNTNVSKNFGDIVIKNSVNVSIG